MEEFECEECECLADCICCDEDGCGCIFCSDPIFDNFQVEAAKIGKPIREIDVEPIKRDNPATAPAEPAPRREPSPQKVPRRTPQKEPERV
jgi:hypothetical protein